MSEQSPAQSAESPFAEHARLAGLVNGLRFQRYPLFLAGLVYEHADGGAAPGDRRRRPRRQPARLGRR
jgi:hypothetical protein